MENIKSKICQNTWEKSNVNWVHKNTNNGAEGILTIWDNSAFKLEDHLPMKWLYYCSRDNA